MFSVLDNKKIKGVGIILLIFHHMYRTVQQITLTGVKLNFLDVQVLSRLAMCARICVYVFVFLSAYGLAYIYEQKYSNNIKSEQHSDGCNTLKFILLQWLKVLFPYWFTIILLWIIWLLIPNLGLASIYGKDKMSIFYMLGDIFPVLDMLGKGEHMFRGVLWYMNFSLIMILLIPIVYELTKKFGFAIIIATMFLFCYIPIGYKSIYGGDYRYYLFAIEMGILFYSYSVFDKLYKVYTDFNIIFKIITIFILLCLSIMFPYVSLFVINSNKFGFSAILNTLGAIALIVAAFLVKVKQLNRLFVIIGTYSLDIYLTHWLLYYPKFIKFIHITDILIAQYLWSVLLAVGIGVLIGVLKKCCGYTTFYNELIKKIS